MVLDADALQANAWDLKRFLGKVRGMAITRRKLLAASYLAAAQAELETSRIRNEPKRITETETSRIKNEPTG